MDLIEYEEHEDGSCNPPEYLFVSRSGGVEFGRLEEEMGQLHGFCLLTIHATAQKVDQLTQQLKDLTQGISTVSDPDFGDITGYAIDGLHVFEIPMWQDTQEFLVKAMCLLLISAFLERSLRSICTALGSGAGNPRAKGGMSKVALYLQYLREDIGLSFEEPQEMMEVRDRCRNLRNHFAHGEWEKVRQGVSAQPLRSAFSACSALFFAIESGYMGIHGDEGRNGQVAT